MKIKGKSIRTFIGSKDYAISRNFYSELGFQEVIISKNMSYFLMENSAFIYKDAYVKDWIDNSMIFFEVDNLQHTLTHIQGLGLTEKYENVRLSDIVYNDWEMSFFFTILQVYYGISAHLNLNI